MMGPLKEHPSRTAARQRIAVRGIRRRDIQIEGFERTPRRITDFVPVTPFDQKQRPFVQFDPLVIHDGKSASLNHKKPLVAAPVAVVRPAFRIPGRQNHLSGLASTVSRIDFKIVLEWKFFIFHVFHITKMKIKAE